MQKLSSRSKHEEFESNSALQIRDQKERRAENARKKEQKVEEKEKRCNFTGLRKFAGCTVHSAALFMSLALFTILFFDVLTHFVSFLVFFQICPL